MKNVNKNFLSEFGARLREEREKLELTQEDFARLGGVQKLSQHKYEKGERSPSIEYLNSLEPYGVNIDYLFDGRKNKVSTSGIDISLMHGIIFELDNSLLRAGVTISANKKARIIAMLYQAFHVTGHVDTSVVDEAVMIAVD